MFTEVNSFCFVFFFSLSIDYSRAPWNQDSPVLRPVTIVFCAFQSANFTIGNSAILSFFIVTCLQFYAFRIYFGGLISEINVEIKANPNSKKLKIMLSNLIQFHLTIKE